MQTEQTTMSAGSRLSDLKPGERGEVVRLEIKGEQRRRLLDLGLIPGTEVWAEFASPLGDPTSYRIRESLIALRRDQAEQILIKRMDNDRNE